MQQHDIQENWESESNGSISTKTQESHEKITLLVRIITSGIGNRYCLLQSAMRVLVSKEHADILKFRDITNIKNIFFYTFLK